MNEKTPQFFEERSNIEEFNLPLFLDPIIKNRWIIALIISACFLSGIVYNINATRIYRAQSSVIIQIRGSSDLLKSEVVQNQGMVSNLWMFKTKVETINSDPMMQKLVVRLIDHGYYRQDLEQAGYDNMSDEKKKNYRNNLALGIKGRISVANPKDTNVVRIAFMSDDPVMSRDVVNFLADVVVEASHDEMKETMDESLERMTLAFQSWRFLW